MRGEAEAQPTVEASTEALGLQAALRDEAPGQQAILREETPGPQAAPREEASGPQAAPQEEAPGSREDTEPLGAAAGLAEAPMGPPALPK